jgi:DNA-binding SARP family transcriptional activator/streptogramin lyase
VEFLLLGPLEVREDGSMIPLSGSKQRALLAILLLHANELVPRDLLLEELYGDRPPGTAGHSLDHQISRLRKTLQSPEVLVTRPGGYVLEIDPECLDSRRFARLVSEGRRANTEGRPADAASLLGEALGLWRGGALADLAYETFGQTEIARLEELRLAALEERIDAELALGQHQAVIGELESLAAKHPERARLHALLMLALYRCGRQEEALRVYAETRRRLVDELGLEPGKDLQQLERAILRQDASLEYAPPVGSVLRKRTRGPVAPALALVLAAAAAAAGVALTHGGTSSSQAQSSGESGSVALVSSASGSVIGTTAVQAPLFSRFYGEALWNVSLAGTLDKIDPESGKVLAFTATVPVPCGLAAGEGSVWISDCSSPTVVRVDPAHTVVLDRFRLPVPQAYLTDATQSVAVGAGSVWVGQGFANPSYVWRLDPRTGRVQHRYVIPEGGAESLAFADGGLWVGGGVIGRLSKIDPQTNEVTTPTRDFGNWLCCVAAGGGYVWAAVTPANRLWKISDDGQVVSSIRLPAKVEDVSYGAGAVWVSDGDAGIVLRVDPTTDATKPYAVGHHVLGVAARRGLLAASVQPSGRDVTANLTGRIAYLALKQNDLDWTSTDPLGTQLAFNADQVQFHYATCAKLFNYPDAPGAVGKRLTPEVAEGWPEATNHGRTYTFRIRPGFAFSPPSHERVDAASFQHEIERVLSPQADAPWTLLGDVVGARAYHGGFTSHVFGVSAHGDTLVIRLVRPATDLPERLALPFFCAVPADLPTVPHGLPYPIPTAGPYYLADRSSDVFVLKPNPDYHGSRPRRLDAIVYRTGVNPGTAAVRLARGSIDYIETRDVALGPGTAAARAAGLRYRLTANNWTERLALNAGRRTFADPRLRRAVAYALDRRALAAGLEGGEFQLPTSLLLPPNLPGSAEGIRYRLRADLRTARRLIAGRHTKITLATSADEAGTIYDPGFVRVLLRNLAAIGISTTVLPLRQTDTPAQRAAVLARADIARVSSNADDARDPVDYLRALPYLPAVDRKRLARIDELPLPRRLLAAAALAARLQRTARYLGFSNQATPELVSKRIGCVIEQPEYPGIDLAALCLSHG